MTDLLTKYLEYLSYEKKYSQLTVSAYKVDLDQFLTFCNDNYQLEQPEQFHVNFLRAWIAQLSHNNIQVSSINRKISSVKGFYRFLIETNTISDSDFVDYSYIKDRRKQEIPFTKEEINAALEDIDNQSFIGARNKLIIEFLYSTGVRRAELINLKIQDISIDEKVCRVSGKRNKQRVIPLIDELIDTLNNYLTYRAEKECNHDYLLVTNKGCKVYNSLIYRAVISCFQNVTLKQKKSPHILRHSLATHMLEENVDINSIKKILGHESLAATQHYMKSDLSMLKKVYKATHPRSKSEDST